MARSFDILFLDGALDLNKKTIVFPNLGLTCKSTSTSENLEISTSSIGSQSFRFFLWALKPPLLEVLFCLAGTQIKDLKLLESLWNLNYTSRSKTAKMRHFEIVIVENLCLSMYLLQETEHSHLITKTEKNIGLNELTCPVVLSADNTCSYVVNNPKRNFLLSSRFKILHTDYQTLFFTR